MSELIPSSPTFRQLNSLSNLPLVRQLGFMLIVAAGIALGTSIVLWSSNSQYSALFLDLPIEESSDVISALEQSGVDYKIDSRTGIISVPSSKVQQTRLQLAGNGLPRSASRGYAILEEEQGLGTSNFMEQARYNRALEQELVQTITHISVVRNARVHLSIPKQSSFIRSSSKPSASVMIDLINLQSMSDSQLNGILHLVTSSVAGLEPERVSIVDQRGNLLSQQSNSEFSHSTEQIRFTRGIEEDYSNRISNLLTPIVGEGNVRTQVSADLDFTSIETTEETYNPNSTVVRSEQTQQESSGPATTESVEPGTLSATPPLTTNDEAEQDVTTTASRLRTNSTRNYEIDRSISLIRTSPGGIRKLSIAVLVDLHAGNPDQEIDPALDQQKIDRLTQLVSDAIGFDAVRGDSVSVIHEPFVRLEEFIEAEPIPMWEQAWFFSAIKQAGAGLVVLLLIFGVLRPALTSVVSGQGNIAGRGNVLPAGSMNLTDDQVSLSAGATPLAAPVLVEKSAYDDNLQLAQTMVKNEPARAARMVQNWLANE